MLIGFLCVFFELWITVLAATVKGRVDVSPFNLTRRSIVNTDFKLIQVGEYQGRPFTSTAKISNLEGDFGFEQVPEPQDASSRTFFVLQASSLDFNLKPNRILVSIERNGSNSTTQLVVKAYKNVFGKENFPSPEIVHPEQLEEIPFESHIPITLVNKAPLRVYVQERNSDLFKSGPIAGILSSKYKLAAVITGIVALIFPSIFSKLESAAALEATEDKLLHQQQQKQSDQSEVQSELENIEKKN
ncbi:LAFA_0G03642g1_1 [Lachancea sp. 'fantastica']|nr:LAFA_0G03642g1_1 [Lachancea sp. 'fantastica']